MCYSCYIQAGSPKIINDKVIAVSELFRGVEQYGNAHLVVGNWNLEDEHIQYCIDATERNDANEDQFECQQTKSFLIALKELNEDERYTAMALGNNFIQ